MKLNLLFIFTLLFITIIVPSCSEKENNPIDKVIGEYHYSDKGVAKIVKGKSSELIINMAYDPSGRNIVFQVTAQLDKNRLIGKWKGITPPTLELEFNGQVSSDFSQIDFAKSDGSISSFDKVVLVRSK